MLLQVHMVRPQNLAELSEVSTALSPRYARS